MASASAAVVNNNDDDSDEEEAPHYRGVLLKFMSFLHGTSYPKAHEFSQAVLLEITPEDIHRYFCLRAFGSQVISSKSTPKLLRDSTLQQYKKAIFHFMPNKGPSWEVRSKTGNPTKSALVNDLLARVESHQVRGEGATARAKQALSLEEFKKLLSLFENKENFQMKYRFTTMIKYQFHLMGRCDDCANFKILGLMGHPNPKFKNFALNLKVRHSKNVHDDKNCPDQIFLGSMDPQVCMLLALAIYLEVWFSFESGGKD